MSDNNREKIASMTIGDALRKIEAGGEESLALLRMIEGNTKPATVGKAVKNAMPQQARKSIVPTATSKPTVITQAAISRSREASGRFVSAKPNEKIQPTQDQGKTLAEILKGGASKTWQEKKGDVKDIAGRAALGPMWDVGVQIKEAFQTTKEKSNQGTAGELRAWGVSKFGKKPGADKDSKAQAAHTKAQAKHDKSEAESDKAEAKHDQHQAKADKAKATVKAGAAGTTVVNNGGGSGGGILSDIAGSWMGSKLGGVAGKVVSKVPLLGKLFPSLAAGGAAPAVAGAGGGMLAKAGGLISKVPGAGLLGKVGGRIPLIGGAITAATTLATGGSKSEAAGAGIGAVAGGALGTIAGPLGTIAGSIAGAWIGEKMGGLFNNQNKAQSDLLSQQDSQQSNFFSQLTSGIGDLVSGLKDKAQAAGSAYSLTRERGGGFIESATAGIKGAFRSTKGKASERESALEQAAIQSGMTDPKELAMFMGQAKHETAGFNTMTEYASGAAYEGRKDLGNTQAGDGKRFKGRGYFQLTGRANYADMSKKVGADLVNKPELAEDPAVAAKIALQYWKDKKLDQAAKAGDFDKVTKRINGGTNGYQDRLDQTQSYNTKYANGVTGGATGKEMPAMPGTPEYSAMQAKFIADQQGTNVFKTKGKRPQVIQAASTSAPPQESKTAITQGVPEYKLPPEPKSIQPEPPPSIETLMAAAAQQQSQTTQQASQNSNSDKGPAAALPHIPTEFSDVQLTLMAYDRT